MHVVTGLFGDVFLQANEEVPSVWTKVCDDLIEKKQPIFTFEAIQRECLKYGIEDERVVRLMLRK